jgi:hypothetical protein
MSKEKRPSKPKPKEDPFDPPDPNDPPSGGGVGPVFDKPVRKEQVPPIINEPPDPEPV